jgi:PAS domain S-box-containing protein
MAKKPWKKAGKTSKSIAAPKEGADTGGVVWSAQGWALDDAETDFRMLLHALPTAVYITDASGRITYYNDAAVQLWGCSPVLGKSEWCGSWRLFKPDGTRLAHEDCPMALTLKHGQPVRGQHAVAERPDGSRVAFMPYPSPLFDRTGTLIGAVNVLAEMPGAQTSEGIDD